MSSIFFIDSMLFFSRNRVILNDSYSSSLVVQTLYSQSYIATRTPESIRKKRKGGHIADENDLLSKKKGGAKKCAE
jgi:hypothetical protein